VIDADSITRVGPTGKCTSSVDAPIDACPRCSNESFHAELTVDRPVFRCADCGVGWIYELGYARAVTAGSTRLWRVADAPHATSR
jgi:transposase-like protein